MHSAYLPFHALSSNRGSASCPSSCPVLPDASHASCLSLVRLFGVFSECGASSPFLKLLSLCFHFFCPSPTSFLISSSLGGNFDCVSGVSLYVATCYQPSRFISSFPLSLKWGFLTSPCLWDQATTMYPFGPQFSVQFTEKACL